MKIQVRTLNNQKHELDIDPSTTVEKLKEIIESKHNYPKSHQTLIFSGKLLNNEQTIESYNIKDQDFIVLLVKKPATAAANPAAPASNPSTATSGTTAPAPATTAPSATPSSSSVTSPAPATSTTSPTPASTAHTPSDTPQTPQTPSSAASSSTPGSGLLSDSASALLTGPEFQSMADSITAMGFPREQVLLALRASFGNPDRALEYLLNGIPSNVPIPVPRAAPPRRIQGQTPVSPSILPSATSQGSQASSASPSSPASPSTGASGYSTNGIPLPENLLPPSMLGNHPAVSVAGRGGAAGRGAGQGGRSGGGGGGGGGGRGGAPGGGSIFDFLRSHPAFPQLIQTARTNPERLQDIVPRLAESFPQLLPLIQQHREEFVDFIRTGGAGGGGGGGGGGIQIHVTPKDQEAINRLIGLGFSRNKVMEAYFLFDRNEDMAANYLLNYGNDDGEIQFISGGGGGGGGGGDDQ